MARSTKSPLGGFGRPRGLGDYRAIGVSLGVARVRSLRNAFDGAAPMQQLLGAASAISCDQIAWADTADTSTGGKSFARALRKSRPFGSAPEGRPAPSPMKHGEGIRATPRRWPGFAIPCWSLGEGAADIAAGEFVVFPGNVLQSPFPA